MEKEALILMLMLEKSGTLERKNADIWCICCIIESNPTLVNLLRDKTGMGYAPLLIEGWFLLVSHTFREIKAVKGTPPLILYNHYEERLVRCSYADFKSKE